MKIQDTETKIVFRCDELFNSGIHIKAYIRGVLCAIVPKSRAKLIFSEYEIPLQEEPSGTK